MEWYWVVQGSFGVAWIARIYGGVALWLGLAFMTCSSTFTLTGANDRVGSIDVD